MKPDDLEQILSGEPEIEPRATFTLAVMAAVRREASEPPPLPFPWRRAAWGLAASAAVGIGIGAAAASAGFSETAATLGSWADLARSRHGAAAAWSAAALLVSWFSWAVPTKLFGLRG